MNRTDRLMAIVWLSRSRSRLTAAELAEAFGVGPRTIYRDIEALCEAGVPIVALPGHGGGYSLVEGYRLSPIPFKVEEVEALWLAGRLLERTGIPTLHDALQSALGKIMAVSPPDRAEHLKRLAEHVVTNLERRGVDPIPAPVFDALRQAVLEGKTVRIRYADVAGKITDRRLTPERLSFQQGAWYVQGADSLSGEARTFRIDRIHDCQLTADPPVCASPPASKQDTVRVCIRMPAANAQWFREHPLFRNWRPELDGEGCLALEVPPSGINALIAALVSFGGQEVVVEPDWFVERLVAAARDVIAAHKLSSET